MWTGTPMVQQGHEFSWVCGLFKLSLWMGYHLPWSILESLSLNSTGAKILTGSTCKELSTSKILHLLHPKRCKFQQHNGHWIRPSMELVLIHSELWGKWSHIENAWSSSRGFSLILDLSGQRWTRHPPAWRMQSRQMSRLEIHWRASAVVERAQLWDCGEDTKTYQDVQVSSSQIQGICEGSKEIF